jgi:hypothetical protein
VGLPSREKAQLYLPLLQKMKGETQFMSWVGIKSLLKSLLQIAPSTAELAKLSALTNELFESSYHSLGGFGSVHQNSVAYFSLRHGLSLRLTCSYMGKYLGCWAQNPAVIRDAVTLFQLHAPLHWATLNSEVRQFVYILAVQHGGTPALSM